MNLVNFDKCKVTKRAYGGKHGGKLGICYRGEYYMLKSVGVIQEYIGSHVYEILGIPAQKTVLGTRKGELVIACRDFRQRPTEFLDLQQFNKIKTTYIPELEDFERAADGDDMRLDMILQVLDWHPMMRRHPEAKERFWEMYFIDALLGNTTRDNTDWGMLVSYEGEEMLAPVYGNTGCFGRCADYQMEWDMKNDAEFDKTVRCVNGPYLNDGDRPISPFLSLKAGWWSDPVERMVMYRLFPVIEAREKAILSFIDSVDVLPRNWRKYFKRLISARIHDVIAPQLHRMEMKLKSMKEITIQVPQEAAEFLEKHEFTPAERMSCIALLMFPFIHSHQLFYGHVEHMLGMSEYDLKSVYSYFGFPDWAAPDDLDTINKVAEAYGWEKKEAPAGAAQADLSKVRRGTDSSKV